MGVGAMKRIVLASCLAAAGTVAAIANIPPPAQPPENLPETIAGLPGATIWHNYSHWVRFAAVRRAYVHFEDSLPASRSEAEGDYLYRIGPSITFGTTYQNMTRLARFENMCPPGSRAGSETCYWQYRIVGLPSLNEIDDVARTRFEPAEIDAYLSARSVTPETYAGAGDDLFGQDVAMHPALDAIVTDQVVTEQECAAVREAIELTSTLNPVSLSAVSLPDAELMHFDGPPPPPSPPIGEQFEFIFPLHAYYGIDGEVVVRGGATADLTALSAQLQAEVWACLSDR